MTIRICIADDHPLIRRGLRILLTSESRMEVVGEAATKDETFKVVSELQPDILLLDLSMPGGNFGDSIRELCQRWPATKIIVLTIHDNIEYVQAALCAGATSYLTKGIADQELLSAIIAVAEGRTVLNLRSDVRVHEILRPAHKQIPAPHVNPLSSREREVITLVAQGFTSAQIANKLFLSVKTIDTYRSRLMTKLGLDSRAELVQFASTKGWLEEATL